MRWNRSLTMGAAFGALALMAASAYAQAAVTSFRKAAASVSVEAERAPADTRPKLTRDATAVQVLASVESAKAWAKKDTVAAGRSLVAAARYVKDALSAAGRETETDTARGLTAAESFGEKLASKTTLGTERAWTTAIGAVRRGMDKLGKAVGGA